MNTEKLEKRNDRSETLRAFQVGVGQYFVESSEGKVCYKVNIDNGTRTCSCADYGKNNGKTPDFTCKHILAVMNSNGGSQKIGFLEREKPKLDERFIVNIKGKDFVVYAGLLDLAHQIGFKKMKPEVVQYPNKDNGNTAICIAYLLARDGREFWDVGDANPKNVNPKVVGHELRMASTRAKARILRDFTNVGMTCLEEIGNFDEVVSDDTPKPKKTTPKKVEPDKSEDAKPPENQDIPKETKPPEKVDTPKETKPPKQDKPKPESNKSGIAPAQKNAIQNLANRRGFTQDELEEMAKQQYGKSVINLTSQEAAKFIRSLQQSA